MTRAHERVWAYFWSFLVAFVCLMICAKTSFLYPISDWVDAQALFSAGKSILQGNVLYRDIYEHKGPLVYMLNAGCALIGHSAMIGVFILETLCFTAFLAAVFRFLRLYGIGRSAYLMLPLAGIAITSSPSFLMGGSAEEYALPALAWALYFIVKWVKTKQPMTVAVLIVNGILCGLVFWMKFTLVGFYIPWLLIPAVHYAVSKRWKHAWRFLGFFALGFVIATLPWLLYFGVNHALSAWLKTYLYDNIFVYGSSAGRFSLSFSGILGLGKAILRGCTDWFVHNLIYAIPLCVGLIFATFRRASSALEKWLLWLLIGFTAAGVYSSGMIYAYYGLVFAAFAGLCALPLCKILDRFPRVSRRTLIYLSIAMLAAAGTVGYLISPNTKDLLKPRDETVQYRIAAVVSRTPNATLLNYGAMDVGFYTACDIAPSVKYFHRPNVPLDEIMDEQNRYVEEGLTDYVVATSAGTDFEIFQSKYTLAAEDSGWSLYRLKSLGEN